MPDNPNLTRGQIANVMRQAGWPEELIPTFSAVALAESSGNPYAHNGDASTGDNSYGLFQVNMLGSLGPDRRRQFGLNSNEDLLDPLTNARAALQIYKQQGPSAWTTFTKGAHKRYMGVGENDPLGSNRGPSRQSYTGGVPPTPQRPPVPTSTEDIEPSVYNSAPPPQANIPYRIMPTYGNYPTDQAYNPFTSAGPMPNNSAPYINQPMEMQAPQPSMQVRPNIDNVNISTGATKPLSSPAPNQVTMPKPVDGETMDVDQYMKYADDNDPEKQAYTAGLIKLASLDPYEDPVHGIVKPYYSQLQSQLEDYEKNHPDKALRWKEEVASRPEFQALVQRMQDAETGSAATEAGMANGAAARVKYNLPEDMQPYNFNELPDEQRSQIFKVLSRVHNGRMSAEEARPLVNYFKEFGTERYDRAKKSFEPYKPYKPTGLGDAVTQGLKESFNAIANGPLSTAMQSGQRAYDMGSELLFGAPKPPTREQLQARVVKQNPLSEGETWYRTGEAQKENAGFVGSNWKAIAANYETMAAGILDIPGVNAIPGIDGWVKDLRKDVAIKHLKVGMAQSDYGFGMQLLSGGVQLVGDTPLFLTAGAIASTGLGAVGLEGAALAIGVDAGMFSLLDMVRANGEGKSATEVFQAGLKGAEMGVMFFGAGKIASTVAGKYLDSSVGKVFGSGGKAAVGAELTENMVNAELKRIAAKPAGTLTPNEEKFLALQTIVLKQAKKNGLIEAGGLSLKNVAPKAKPAPTESIDQIILNAFEPKGSALPSKFGRKTPAQIAETLQNNGIKVTEEQVTESLERYATNFQPETAAESVAAIEEGLSQLRAAIKTPEMAALRKATPGFQRAYVLSKVVGLGTRVGTIGGGIFAAEKMRGADTKDALHAAAQMALLDFVMHGISGDKSREERLRFGDKTVKKRLDDAAGTLTEVTVTDTNEKIVVSLDPKGVIYAHDGTKIDPALIDFRIATVRPSPEQVANFRAKQLENMDVPSKTVKAVRLPYTVKEGAEREVGVGQNVFRNVPGQRLGVYGKVGKTKDGLVVVYSEKGKKQMVPLDDSWRLTSNERRNVVPSNKQETPVFKVEGKNVIVMRLGDKKVPFYQKEIPGQKPQWLPFLGVDKETGKLKTSDNEHNYFGSKTLQSIGEQLDSRLGDVTPKEPVALKADVARLEQEASQLETTLQQMRNGEFREQIVKRTKKGRKSTTTVLRDGTPEEIAAVEKKLVPIQQKLNKAKAALKQEEAKREALIPPTIDKDHPLLKSASSHAADEAKIAAHADSWQGPRKVIAHKGPKESYDHPPLPPREASNKFDGFPDGARVYNKQLGQYGTIRTSEGGKGRPPKGTRYIETDSRDVRKISQGGEGEPTKGVAYTRRVEDTAKESFRPDDENFVGFEYHVPEVPKVKKGEEFELQEAPDRWKLQEGRTRDDLKDFTAEQRVYENVNEVRAQVNEVNQQITDYNSLVRRIAREKASLAKKVQAYAKKNPDKTLPAHEKAAQSIAELELQAADDKAYITENLKVLKGLKEDLAENYVAAIEERKNPPSEQELEERRQKYKNKNPYTPPEYRYDEEGQPTNAPAGKTLRQPREGEQVVDPRTGQVGIVRKRTEVAKTVINYDGTLKRVAQLTKGRKAKTLQPDEINKYIASLVKRNAITKEQGDALVKIKAETKRLSKLENLLRTASTEQDRTLFPADYTKRQILTERAREIGRGRLKIGSDVSVRTADRLVVVVKGKSGFEHQRPLNGDWELDMSTKPENPFVTELAGPKRGFNEVSKQQQAAFEGAVSRSGISEKQQRKLDNIDAVERLRDKLASNPKATQKQFRALAEKAYAAKLIDDAAIQRIRKTKGSREYIDGPNFALKQELFRARAKAAKTLSKVVSPEQKDRFQKAKADQLTLIQAGNRLAQVEGTPQAYQAFAKEVRALQKDGLIPNAPQKPAGRSGAAVADWMQTVRDHIQDGIEDTKKVIDNKGVIKKAAKLNPIEAGQRIQVGINALDKLEREASGPNTPKSNADKVSTYKTFLTNLQKEGLIDSESSARLKAGLKQLEAKKNEIDAIAEEGKSTSRPQDKFNELFDDFKSDFRTEMLGVKAKAEDGSFEITPKEVVEEAPPSTPTADRLEQFSQRNLQDAKDQLDKLQDRKKAGKLEPRQVGLFVDDLLNNKLITEEQRSTILKQKNDGARLNQAKKFLLEKDKQVEKVIAEVKTEAQLKTEKQMQDTVDSINELKQFEAQLQSRKLDADALDTFVNELWQKDVIDQGDLFYLSDLDKPKDIIKEVKGILDGKLEELRNPKTKEVEASAAETAEKTAPAEEASAEAAAETPAEETPSRPAVQMSPKKAKAEAELEDIRAQRTEHAKTLKKAMSDFNAIEKKLEKQSLTPKEREKLMKQRGEAKKALREAQSTAEKLKRQEAKKALTSPELSANEFRSRVLRLKTKDGMSNAELAAATGIDVKRFQSITAAESGLYSEGIQHLRDLMSLTTEDNPNPSAIYSNLREVFAKDLPEEFSFERTFMITDAMARKLNLHRGSHMTKQGYLELLSKFDKELSGESKAAILKAIAAQEGWGDRANKFLADPRIKEFLKQARKEGATNWDEISRAIKKGDIEAIREEFNTESNFGRTSGIKAFNVALEGEPRPFDENSPKTRGGITVFFHAGEEVGSKSAEHIAKIDEAIAAMERIASQDRTPNDWSPKMVEGTKVLRGLVDDGILTMDEFYQINNAKHIGDHVDGRTRAAVAMLRERRGGMEQPIEQQQRIAFTAKVKKEMGQGYINFGPEGLTVERKGSQVFTDSKGIALFNKVVAKLGKKSVIGLGGYIPKEHVGKVIAEMEKLAAQMMKKNDTIGAIQLNRLMKEMTTASKSPNGDISMIPREKGFESLERMVAEEEAAHMADMRVNSRVDVNPFKNVESYNTAVNNLRHRYPTSKATELHREVIAKAFNTHAERELGLTSSQVDEILDVYREQLQKKGITPEVIEEQFGRINEKARQWAAEYGLDELRDAKATGPDGTRETDAYAEGRRAAREEGMGDYAGNALKGTEPDSQRKPSYEDFKLSPQEEASLNDIAPEYRDGVREHLRQIRWEMEQQKQAAAAMGKSTAKGGKKGGRTKEYAEEVGDITDALPDSKLGLVGKVFMEVASAGKSAASALDISAVGRQGWILLAAHPSKIIPAIYKGLRSYSKEYADSITTSLRENPYFEYAEKMGLKLAAFGDRSELYQSKVFGEDQVFKNTTLEKGRRGLSWHVRASERSFNAVIDSLRLEMFVKGIEQGRAKAAREGVEFTDIDAKEVATWLNIASGVGNLPTNFLGFNLDKATPFLNLPFYSVRLAASRFQVMNPMRYYHMRQVSPIAANFAMKQLGKFLAVNMLVLLGAKAAGAKITLDDPTDPGAFRLTVPHGDATVSFDVMAGLPQFLTLASRTVAYPFRDKEWYPFRKAKMTGSGQKDRDLLDTYTGLYLRAARKKASPFLGSVLNVISGENVMGEPTNVATEALNYVKPIGFKQFSDNYRDAGVDTALMLGVSEFLGFSASLLPTADMYNKRIAEIQSDTGMDLKEKRRYIKSLTDMKNYAIRENAVRTRMEKEGSSLWNLRKMWEYTTPTDEGKKLSENNED